MYREVRVSRVESAGGAISGVCFAPGSHDQLRTSPVRGLRRTVGEGRGEEPSIVAALPGMHI